MKTARTFSASMAQGTPSGFWILAKPQSNVDVNIYEDMCKGIKIIHGFCGFL